jgi:hypothetical protein
MSENLKRKLLVDTSNNHVTADQIRNNIKGRMNTEEYKNAMKQLVKEMKLEKPYYFNK